MIKVKAAAAKVGLSVSTLNKLRCLGGGPPFYKLGVSVFYRQEDIDAWLAERRRSSTWAGSNCNSSNRQVAA